MDMSLAMRGHKNSAEGDTGQVPLNYAVYLNILSNYRILLTDKVKARKT